MAFDYQFENLGEDRFQHFCQALLIPEFSNVQCFPIHQQDGGRDAISMTWATLESPFIVYQVKYVRRPQAEPKPWKWLVETIEAELPKVQKLIQAGAEQYILMTNVSGTAHPDSGSIDKMNTVLRSTISIPSQCWWRDDLSRRLDNQPDLRWAFSELITGPDLLRLLLEFGLQDNLQRRSRAIATYLSDQFKQDKEVRFKQVELQNNLLELFIDVPVFIPRRGRHQGRSVRRFRHLSRHYAVDQEFTGEEEEQIGCAATLLEPLFQREFPLVVIEGAPGQGKSTIVQYVSQLHRMRLLNHQFPGDHPDRYQPLYARLPFKIDLRDFSTWMSGGNPFVTDTEDSGHNGIQRSLETFLSAQVTHHSGGASFSVDDLHAVVQASAILLVLDGLDEIADLSRRTAVTHELCRSINRLKGVALDLQCIITSRPSVFADSPSFSEDYLYLELRSITKSQIKSYADKWIKAKQISGKDASDIQKILNEKIDQPHLAELSRNPMQLAILLSLIHSRGSSLPEKRTALYYNYMEYFFGREAEKSPVVRMHRDLLIDIHCYLAWLLHAESESGGNGGSVSRERLLSLVREYLTNEEHDESLAESLFAGMVERVVALVSRVEGTFEFEVQPLREYFAARCLYETAPYSPPGAEKQGTLPDRFDAIARNGYWLNVTRFYAGCFSKGELPALVDRLEELLKDPVHKYTSYTRVLAAMLLGDWVFSQHPKSMKKVIDIVLDGVGRRHFTNSEMRRRRPDTLLRLPERSGRDELLEKCFSILLDEPPLDFALSIISLGTSNSDVNQRMHYCMDFLQDKKGDSFSNWLTYALHLQVLGRLDPQQVERIFEKRKIEPRHVSLLIRGGQTAILEASHEEYAGAVRLILDRQILPYRRRRARSWLEVLLLCFEPFHYREFFHSPIFLRHTLTQPDTGAEVNGDLPFTSEIKAFAEGVDEHIRMPTREWARTLLPWTNIVETGRHQFGEAWAFCELAGQAAGIKSSKEKGADFTDLFDKDMSLCGRARYARLRAGNSKWWSNTLARASNRLDQMLAVLVLLSWGSPKTIVANAEALGERLNALCTTDWLLLAKSLNRIGFVLPDKQSRDLGMGVNELGIHQPERLTAAIWPRLSRTYRDVLYDSVIGPYSGKDVYILDICQGHTLVRLLSRKMSWEIALARIASTYEAVGNADTTATYRLMRDVPRNQISLEIAESILDAPDSYPTDLVSVAESVLRHRLSKSAAPVMQIATEQGWFRSLRSEG